MAYTKHTWVNNEDITAARLNNIEEGITEASQSGGMGFDIVIRAYGTITYSSGTLSLLSTSTPQELYEKAENGDPISCIVYEVVGSGMYFTTTPYICTVDVTSVPNALFITHKDWSIATIEYDTEGLRKVIND